MTDAGGLRLRTLVVVPALNEEDAIGAVVTEIRAAVPEVDVLVVNDGSRDGTSAVAAAAGAWVLDLPYWLGVGGAMRAGFRFALRHGYEAVVQVDADGQHDPAEIPRLVEALGYEDVVVGGRFSGRGAYEVGVVRRLAMRFLAGIVSWLVRARLRDVTSGFRAAGPAAIPVFAEHYPVEYLGDTLESLVIAAQAGLRVGEVPVQMRARAGGRPSTSPAWAAAYVLRALLVLALASSHGRGPRREPVR